MMAFVFFNSHFPANITQSIDTYIHVNILTDFSVGMAVVEAVTKIQPTKTRFWNQIIDNEVQETFHL